MDFLTYTRPTIGQFSGHVSQGGNGDLDMRLCRTWTNVRRPVDGGNNKAGTFQLSDPLDLNQPFQNIHCPLKLSLQNVV